MDLSNIGGRKLIMALILLVVAVGVTYVKGDVPNNLLTFMQTIFGAFVLGNMAEHTASVFKNNKTPDGKEEGN